MLKKTLVMGILLDGPRHGYEINKLIRGSMQKAFELNPASTYYTLEKLEKEKLVRRTNTQDGNRPMKYVYSLTPEGKAEFMRLLSDSLTKEQEPIFPIDLGLVFLNRLPSADARAIMESRIARFKSRLAEMEALREKGLEPQGGDVPNHGWFLDHKIAHLRAEIDWEEKFIQEMVYSRT
jgi:DNA-binding PadR family transcriptional regulator